MSNGQRSKLLGIIPFYLDMTGKEFHYCFGTPEQRIGQFNFKKSFSSTPNPQNYADIIEAFIEYKFTLMEHKAQSVFRRKVLFEKIKQR